MTQLDSTPKIVKFYLDTTGLSMRKFAAALNCSHSAVSNWASGKAVPDPVFLDACIREFSDWRHLFAQQLLALRFPGIDAINNNGHKGEQS
jgi:transcriptional regulator with XRE-family HTH domain